MLHFINEQFRSLQNNIKHEVQSGHLNLSDDIWISSDPRGEAKISLHYERNGFCIEITKGDTGAWSCIGMRIPKNVATVEKHIKVSISYYSNRIVGLRPRLRTFNSDGTWKDSSPRDPLVSLPGHRTAKAVLSPIVSNSMSIDNFETSVFFLGNSVSLKELNISISH